MKICMTRRIKIAIIFSTILAVGFVIAFPGSVAFSKVPPCPPEELDGQTQLTVFRKWGFPIIVYDSSHSGIISTVGASRDLKKETRYILRYSRYGKDVFIDKDGCVMLISDIKE
jgi:hypothetical protein